MGIGTPLTTITLGAASVADDLGYVALGDLVRHIPAFWHGRVYPPEISVRQSRCPR
jgi:hypothetical protein